MYVGSLGFWSEVDIVYDQSTPPFDRVKMNVLRDTEIRKQLLKQVQA